MLNLKGGILYSRCPSIETRHLARQVGGASAGFFFIKFIGKLFVKHGSEEEGGTYGVQARLSLAHSRFIRSPRR